MKQIFTLLTVGTLCILTKTSIAQYSENFESTMSSLSGNCWQFDQVNHTSESSYTPISGTGSLYSHPPTNTSNTRDFATPYLDIPMSMQVSFKYQLSNALHNSATRIIEVGLMDSSRNFTSLHTITMDENSPLTVQSYNNTFTLASASVQRLVFRLGGKTGDGNTRLLFDDLYTNASTHYGPATTCNRAPVAVNDTLDGSGGQPVTGNVMINDSDPDGESIRSSIVAPSTDGTVVLNSDGSFTFTPNPGFSGLTTTFTYQLTDNGYDPMTSNTATVTINYTYATGNSKVKLVSFQGSRNDDLVSLKWDVTKNENAQRFVVEKSLNGTDYSVIGMVAATGRKGKESYGFENTCNNNAKVMYRLKIVDDNNTAEYSKALVFQQDNTDNIKVMSNPVNDKLTISYLTAYSQSVYIKVYDMNSHLHMTYKTNVYPGLNVINFPLASTIKSGLYIVDINDGSQRHLSKSAKFLKE
jgi:hypothetical protein